MDGWGFGDINNISHRYPQRGRQLAQDGNAGVGAAFFNFHQHALADAGATGNFVQ
jgi:hypothetical protein